MQIELPPREGADGEGVGAPVWGVDRASGGGGQTVLHWNQHIPADILTRVRQHMRKGKTHAKLNTLTYLSSNILAPKRTKLCR